MIISTFCQNESCDKEIETVGVFNVEANIMKYVCQECGTSQEQTDWVEA